MALNMLDTFKLEIISLIRFAHNNIASQLSVVCSEHEFQEYAFKWELQISRLLIRFGVNDDERYLIELVEAILGAPYFWSKFAIPTVTKNEANNTINALIENIFRRCVHDNQNPLSMSTRLYFIFFFPIERNHASDVYKINVHYRQIRSRNEILEKENDGTVIAKLQEEIRKIRIGLKPYILQVNLYSQIADHFPRNKSYRAYTEESICVLFAKVYQLLRTISYRPIHLECENYLSQRLDIAINWTSLSAEFKLRCRLLLYLNKELNAVHNDIVNEMPNDIQASFKNDAANAYKNDEYACKAYFTSLCLLQQLFIIKAELDGTMRKKHSKSDLINILHTYKAKQTNVEVVHSLNTLETYLDDTHTKNTPYEKLGEMIHENLTSLSPYQPKNITNSEQFGQFKTRMENYLTSLLKIYSILEKIIDLTLSTHSLADLETESLKLLSADTWDNQFSLMITRIRKFIVDTIGNNNPAHSKVSFLTRSLERTSPGHLAGRGPSHFRPSRINRSSSSEGSDDVTHIIGPPKSTIASPKPAAAVTEDTGESRRGALNIREKGEEYERKMHFKK